MRRQVAEIQDLLNPDTLAKEIVSMFDTWNTQRQQQLSNWQELRNYLFATDTRTTTNSKNGWKNSTTIPKLTQIRDNLHANYMAALVPSDDWIKWEAYDKTGKDSKKVTAIKAYIDTKLRESNFRETIAKVLYDYIDYGNSFGEVIYTNKSKVDPVTGEEIAGYIGPELVRLSPYDIVFNPLAPSFKESPKITRYLKSFGDLEYEVNSRPDLAYNREVLNKAGDIRKKFSGYKVEDFNKATSLRIDGYGDFYTYLGSNVVEILEFEGNIYDFDNNILLENYIITVIDRTWVVRKEQNPSWMGYAAKLHTGWRERPDNLYCMGPLDNLVGMQYRLDHLENLKADALDLTIHPPLKIVGDVEPFEYGPFCEIRIPEDGDVVQMPPNPAAFQVNNEIGYIMMIMEEMSGAPKEAMGIRTPGEKTAFEVQQLQLAAGRIFQDKITKFELEFLEPCLNMMLEVARRNLNAADLVRVMDDDFGVEDFITISKEDITAKGKIKPVGARHFSSQAQLLQNLVSLSNTRIWDNIAAHVSSKKLAKYVENLLQLERADLIRDNVAIFEQAETQQLISQASQELEVMQNTPGIEEGLAEGVL